MEDIEHSLKSLIRWIEGENYMGYDPYDFLSSPFSAKFGKDLQFYIQQVGKLMPINLRSFFGIKKAYNPKGLALISMAYMNLYEAGLGKDNLKKAEMLIDTLEGLRSPGFSEYAWGYNFSWASRGFYLPAYAPSIVVSSTVGKMLLKHYKLTGDVKSLKKAVSIGDFILKRLNRYETEEHLCFSYTPYDHTRTFNASLMGAELLSMIYSITKEDILAEEAAKAVEYVLSEQKNDGSWLYGYSDDGVKIELYDFHQGFILDSLKVIGENLGMDLSKALEKGIRFYKEKLFYQNGMSVYRYPKAYPIDIHNQAQGIISFLRHGDRHFSERIALFTIAKMQDKDGYFYYQAWPGLTNKIPYIRWGQAWMLLSISYFIKAGGEI